MGIDGKYANNKEYSIECCQPAGTYELDCKDEYGDGWHGGSIEIGGTEYCRILRMERARSNRFNIQDQLQQTNVPISSLKQKHGARKSLGNLDLVKALLDTVKT